MSIVAGRCSERQPSTASFTFDDALVWVEVVTAPGLEPGRRLHLTRAAVEAMTTCSPDSTPATDRQPHTPIIDRATG